jgi:protein SHQ1
LHFDQDVVEDGSESAHYDVDKGELTVSIPKRIKGEAFTGLDMLTKLITKPTSQQSRPGIAELDCQEDEGEDDETQWDFEQVLRAERDDPLVHQGPKYGFALRYCGHFRDLMDEISEILDNPCPEQIPTERRLQQQTAAEDEAFDVEHYLSRTSLRILSLRHDQFEVSVFESALTHTPSWEVSLRCGFA